jgi:hypothetical protein
VQCHLPWLFRQSWQSQTHQAATNKLFSLYNLCQIWHENFSPMI